MMMQKIKVPTYEDIVKADKERWSELEQIFCHDFLKWFRNAVLLTEIEFIRDEISLTSEKNGSLETTDKGLKFLRKCLKSNTTHSKIQEFLNGTWEVVELFLTEQRIHVYSSFRVEVKIERLKLRSLRKKDPRTCSCKSYIRLRDILNIQTRPGETSMKKVVLNCIANVIFKCAFPSREPFKITSILDEYIPSIRTTNQTLLEKKGNLDKILDLISSKNEKKDANSKGNTRPTKKQKKS